MSSASHGQQVPLDRTTPSTCRVMLDNPPVNVMGTDFDLQMRAAVTALENDDRTKVVTFESAVEGVLSELRVILVATLASGLTDVGIQ